MVDFIAEIYEYAQIIPTLKEIIEKCYKNDEIHVKRLWDNISGLIISFSSEVAKTDINLANRIINGAELACSYTNGEIVNYRLMGDKLSETITLFYDGMALFGKIDVDDGKYRLVSSKSGYISLANNETAMVYNSLEDPIWEAQQLVERVYSPSFTTFKCLGAGMGYFAWQLFCASDMSIDIYVYHTSEKLVNYALDYGLLSLIPDDKLHIVVCEDEQLLIDEYEQEPVFGRTGHINLGDVFDILTDKVKRRVAQLDAGYNTFSLWENQLEINFWRNIKNVQDLYTSYKIDTNSESWIVVVAGPSLDSKLQYIKENVGKKNIICASTVLKKLLDYGIKPNCVAVLDPQSRTFGHFEGLNNTEVTLLLNSTGNWMFGEKYTGPKYLVPSETNETSILYFAARGVSSLNLGSTVSSMAINMAIYYGAKTIELVGLDLAYPGGKSHSSGTMDYKTISTNGMIDVPCVSGGIVPTTPQFIYYINVINAIIRENNSVKFIDYSDCGAKFEGAVYYKDLANAT